MDLYPHSLSVWFLLKTPCLRRTKARQKMVSRSREQLPSNAKLRSHRKERKKVNSSDRSVFEACFKFRAGPIAPAAPAAPVAVACPQCRLRHPCRHYCFRHPCHPRHRCQATEGTRAGSPLGAGSGARVVRARSGIPRLTESRNSHGRVKSSRLRLGNLSARNSRISGSNDP